MSKGKAFLVGAGPGDVGLITVKGLEAIQQAEVILYDRLANPKLLEFAAEACELIYCGKLPDRHSLRQEHINDLLVAKVAEGKRVVRLKGGDPGVFGRVGEEAEALSKHGFAFEMIPGITSGIAAPLYAGIPVTHREFGETFAIVTAHDKSKDGKSRLNWEGIAKGIDTIAFYMGVKNLPHICENLMKYGKPASTPVILIQWGTFGRQQTLEGTLETIVEKVQQEQFMNPAITLVGEIVSLRNKISWFEHKRLYGKQILLPRTGTDKSTLAKRMMDEGADVHEFPRWKRQTLSLDHTVKAKLSEYEQLLFTSPESVEEFFTLLIGEGVDIRNVRGNLLGLSSKSVKAIQSKGFHAQIPSGVLDLTKATLTIATTSDEQDRQKWMEQYEGADILITSHLTLDDSWLTIFKRTLSDAKLNTVVFPSSASVELFVQLIDRNPFLQDEWNKELDLYCLGEQTYHSVQQLLKKTCMQAKVPTVESLIECMAKERS